MDLPGGPAAGLSRLTDLAVRLLDRSGASVTVRVSLPEDGQPEAAGLVTGAYLGVAILAAGGAQIGTLCACSREPRPWSADDVEVLEAVASAVAAQLELRALSGEYAASRVRWDLALDAAQIGSFDLDLVTGQLHCDDRMTELFGYPPGAFPPDLAAGTERIAEQDRERVLAAVREAVATSGPYLAEYRVVLPDGGERWLVACGRALGPDGAAVRLVGTVQDVTEARIARDEAARLLATMTTGFIAVDRDWRVTYVNAEASRVVGTAPHELVGRDLWEAFPGRYDNEFGEFFRRAMSTDEPVELEAFYPHLDGWFDVRAVPSRDGLSVFFTEVSSRRADRERADAASGRLQLLARISEALADASLGTEQAVARLARLMVPDLADWALVSLLDGQALRDVGCWHADPELRETVETYVQYRLVGRSDLGAVDRARETGRVVTVERGLTRAVVPTLGHELAVRALQELAPESVVVVPLVARGHLVGLLTLLRGAERPPMGPDGLTLVQEIGARAGLALDNARLFAEQRGLADRLQQALLTPAAGTRPPARRRALPAGRPGGPGRR